MHVNCVLFLRGAPHVTISGIQITLPEQRQCQESAFNHQQSIPCVSSLSAELQSAQFPSVPLFSRRHLDVPLMSRAGGLMRRHSCLMLSRADEDGGRLP